MKFPPSQIETTDYWELSKDYGLIHIHSVKTFGKSKQKVYYCTTFIDRWTTHGENLSVEEKKFYTSSAIDKSSVDIKKTSVTSLFSRKNSTIKQNLQAALLIEVFYDKRTTLPGKAFKKR